MLKIQDATNQKKSGIFKKFILPAIDTLHHLAFLNSLQATVITTVSSEKIITDNKASVNLRVIPEGNYQQKKVSYF